MCGLFGLAGGLQTNELPLARAARDRLAHRGPDYQHDFVDDWAYIGHTRLSIIDLSLQGRQPMVSDDGAVVIAVNGEIYNFAALRADLEREHEFRSRSDSEVILHGYRAWGLDELLARIEGMYAFVIYDVAQRTIHLVRDRVGIKPLYYGVVAGRLVWASELKSLTAFCSGLPIDHSALYDYLTYRYIPAPKSLYRGIAKLEPGTVLSWRENSTGTKKSYWRLTPGSVQAPVEEVVSGLSDVLTATVRDQLVADAPLGFFLSGGLDSSAVVGLASALQGDLHTYSIGFDVRGHSELPYARSVAEQLHTAHVEQTQTEAAAVELSAQMSQWFDEPFADTSALPTYLVAQLAARDVKVVLTGDGGDEVFGGYRWYPSAAARAERSWRAPVWTVGVTGWLKSHLPIMRRFARGAERFLLLDGYDYYARLMGGLISNEKQAYCRLWQIPSDYDDYWYFRSHDDPSLPMLTRLQALDFQTYLPDDVLTKVDRTTMANSLEARVPLLGTRVIEHVFAFDESSRLRAEPSKALLRRVVADRLPGAILRRSKQGFGVPAFRWREGVFDPSRSRQENLLFQCFPELVD